MGGQGWIRTEERTLTFLKCSRAPSVAWQSSMHNFTPAMRTPWCLSMRRFDAGPVNDSLSSGTLRTIRTAHKAAYKTHITPPCTNEALASSCLENKVLAGDTSKLKSKNPSMLPTIFDTCQRQSRWKKHITILFGPLTITKDLDDVILKHEMAIIYHNDAMPATMRNLLFTSILCGHSLPLSKGTRLEATIKASSCLIHHQVHKLPIDMKNCSGNLSAWSESIEILNFP